MKKLLAAAALFALSFGMNAQELGLRFGDVAYNDFGVDAVFSAGEFSRIHADVSFGNGGVGIDALYDFLYKPVADTPLNWYVGVGPSLNIGHADDFWLGVSGEIGLEYRFEGAPIALGADWRPTAWIIEDSHFNGGGFGVNVRYIFK